MDYQIATRRYVNTLLPGTFSTDLDKVVLYEEVINNTGLTVHTTNTASELAYTAKQAMLEIDIKCIQVFEVECNVKFCDSGITTEDSGYTGTNCYNKYMLESSSGTIGQTGFTFNLSGVTVTGITIEQFTGLNIYGNTAFTQVQPTMQVTQTGSTAQNPFFVEFSYQANPSTTDCVVYKVYFHGSNNETKVFELVQDDDQSIFYFTNQNLGNLNANGGTVRQFGLNYGKKNQIHWEGFDRNTIRPVTAGTGNISENINWTRFDPTDENWLRLVRWDTPPSQGGGNSYITFEYDANEGASARTIVLVMSGLTLGGRIEYCYATSAMTPGTDYVSGVQQVAQASITLSRDGSGNLSSTGGSAYFNVNKVRISAVTAYSVSQNGATITNSGDTGSGNTRITVNFTGNTSTSNVTHTVYVTGRTTSNTTVTGSATIQQNGVGYISFTNRTTQVGNATTSTTQGFTHNCQNGTIGFYSSSTITDKTFTYNWQRQPTGVTLIFSENYGVNTITREVCVSGTSTEGITIYGYWTVHHIGVGGEVEPGIPEDPDNPVVPEEPEDPEEEFGDYLALEMLGSGTVTWKSAENNSTKTIEYSTDEGGTWTSITSSTSGTQIPVQNGDFVYVRGTNDSYSGSSFQSTTNFNLSGNIMSLVWGDDFESHNEFKTNSTNVFSGLFGGAPIVSASALTLPSTSLVNFCYRQMFSGCTSMTTAPALPATTLANNCYNNMFAGCTSLTAAPALPATAMSDYCYSLMFRNCTSLTTAPALPATSLAASCYYQMFNGCTSLTTAPALPATTLATSCYSDMFVDCASLTTAPELPATTLVQTCYQGMFQFCSSLNYIKCLATDVSASGCTVGWVDSVAATGTFVKAAGMNSWTTGDDGIPVGWTTQSDV